MYSCQYFPIHIFPLQGVEQQPIEGGSCRPCILCSPGASVSDIGVIVDGDNDDGDIDDILSDDDSEH